MSYSYKQSKEKLEMLTLVFYGSNKPATEVEWERSANNGMLSYKPADRIKAAQEMIKDLQRYIQSERDNLSIDILYDEELMLKVAEMQQEKNVQKIIEKNRAAWGDDEDLLF